MAAKQHLDQLRHQIEQLRKDSLNVVASANKIVYNGVQKLADRELKALNDYYRGALDSIKKANRNDIRGLAQQQLDLLQDTVNQVISHARESMSIVAETRAELAKLVQKGIKGEKVALADLNRAAAPAKKAVTQVKTAAKKATQDARKSVKTVRQAGQGHHQGGGSQRQAHRRRRDQEGGARRAGPLARFARQPRHQPSQEGRHHRGGVGGQRRIRCIQRGFRRRDQGKRCGQEPEARLGSSLHTRRPIDGGFFMRAYMCACLSESKHGCLVAWTRMSTVPTVKLSIAESTELCRLLADPSRLRLLLLLEAHALSAAELTEVTGLAQSRVSTHLARLKRSGLVQDQRTGGAALYTLAAAENSAAELWSLMRQELDDRQARLDRERADEVVRLRKSGQTWAESVAGRMELHYSPGRTWEATAHGLIGLLQLGDVLDIASGDGVLAELIAERARSVTCMDISAKVLAAARKRLGAVSNVSFCQGDMRAPPFADSRFDQVFLMHALELQPTIPRSW